MPSFARLTEELASYRERFTQAVRLLPVHATLAMCVGYGLLALVGLACVSNLLLQVGVLTPRGDEPSRIITVGDCYMLKMEGK